MAANQEERSASGHAESKLLEKITRNYERLDEKLNELEAKMANLEFEDDRTCPPNKPR